MTVGSQLKHVSLLSVPTKPGAEPSSFSTTSYLNAFDLEDGTGRLIYPHLDAEGSDGYVDLSRMPKIVALTQETIPGIWSTAEDLLAQAQRLGNRYGVSECVPIISTKGEWRIEEVDAKKGMVDDGYYVDFISRSYNWVSFRQGEFLEAEVHRGCEDSFSNVTYRLSRDAILEARFKMNVGALGIELIRKAMNLPKGISLEDFAFSIAQQLQAAGLYFADIDALRVATSIDFEDFEGAITFNVESSDVGWHMVGPEGERYEEPRGESLERELNYKMYERGNADMHDSLAPQVATIRWGKSKGGEYPELMVQTRLSGGVLHPLKSPLKEILWDPFVIAD